MPDHIKPRCILINDHSYLLTMTNSTLDDSDALQRCISVVIDDAARQLIGQVVEKRTVDIEATLAVALKDREDALNQLRICQNALVDKDAFVCHFHPLVFASIFSSTSDQQIGMHTSID